MKVHDITQKIRSVSGLSKFEYNDMDGNSHRYAASLGSRYAVAAGSRKAERKTYLLGLGSISTNMPIKHQR
jgi:hypothetical protein